MPLERRHSVAPAFASTGPRSHERGDFQARGWRRGHCARLQRGRALTSAEMTRGRGRATQAVTGFNGAALSRARRSPGHKQMGRTNANRASTGPRSHERGDRAQWCRVPMTCVALQRGRALTSAEMTGRHFREVDANLASTGPRSHERGDMIPRVQPLAAYQLASTGPRSHERGDHNIKCGVNVRDECFNGAALSRARR